MKIDSTLKPLGIIALIILVLFVVIYGLNVFRQSNTQTVGMMGSVESFGEGSATIGRGVPVAMPEMMEPGDIGMMKYSDPYFSPIGATPEEREQIGERIIQTGWIYMRVDDAAKRLEEVRGLVESSGGFIADSSLSEQSGITTANVAARIPLAQYQDIRNKIRAIGSTIFNESSHADDVTDQFVDLDARLRSARAEEEQYLEILDRATTIEDTLRVTAQLSQVRSRIEQMEGQMRFLQDRTEYATLNITMTEEARVNIPTDEWRPGEVLREALRDLVIVAQELINFVITAFIFIVGLLLPFGLILWLFMWIWKRIAAVRKHK